MAASAAKVSTGGIERRGVWGGKNGTLFPHLPTIVVEKDAASDHAALWGDILRYFEYGQEEVSRQSWKIIGAQV